LGIIGCLFSDIVKTTSLKERSSVLSRIMVGRQVSDLYLRHYEIRRLQILLKPKDWNDNWPSV